MKLRTSHIIFGCVLGLVLSYLTLRFTGHLQSFGGNIFAALPNAINTFGTTLTERPFALPRITSVSLIFACIAFFTPILAVLYMVSEMGNFDLGAEYGDARWATLREMAQVGDREQTSNNLMLSAHCWLVRQGRTQQQRKTLQGRNANVYIVGTSGTGKSFQYVKPQVMQAVGSILDPKRESPITKLFIGFLGYQNAEQLIKKPSEDTPATQDQPAPGGEDLKRQTALSAKMKAQIASGIASMVAAQQKKMIVDGGHDIFVTDPKGDGIEDVGHLLEAAAYDIRCLNLIDTKRSLHYNPLAYIQTRLIDAKSPEQIHVALTAEIDGKPMDAIIVKDQGVTKSITGGLGSITCTVNTQTTSLTPETEASVDKQLKEDIYDLMSRRGDDFKEAISKIEYRTSTMFYDIEYRNLDWAAHEVSITLALDSVLECTSIDDASALTCDDPANPHVITWNLGVVDGRAKGIADALVVPCMLGVATRIEHRRIPDGISLAKTVDCLVANLKEPDKAQGGDGQFWEDTERLMLMSLISYLFEHYGPRYRTLGEVLRFLTMAKVSNDPNYLSELDIVMESWETGYIWQATKASEETISAKRRRKSQGQWVETEYGPHNPADSLALHCYHAFKSGAAETLQSIVISCHAALVKLFPKEIQELVSYDEMHLDTLGEADKRQAIFAIVDDTDKTFNFLFALLIFQTINLNCDKAYKKYGGKLPRHIHFILDEFANIGKIPDFARIISVVRSRNMSVSVILQSLTQLTSVYEKDADTIRDNCSTMLFLGGQSEKTLEGLSKLAGSETVDEITVSKQRGSMSSNSANRGRHARELVTISQLRELDIQNAIVMMSGLKPVKDKKIETQKHPLYRYINPTSKREKGEAKCLYTEKFNIIQYRQRREKGEQRIASQLTT